MNLPTAPNRFVPSSRPFVKSLVGCLSLALIVGGISSARGATANVGVVGFSFSPKVLNIQAGDKVIWTGLGLTHSVTGDTPPETLCGASFPGSCTNVFNTPGTYLYHCINHAALFNMTGMVHVAAVTLPPTVAITRPADGDVFAAPASIRISAPATNAGGSVTNVQFFHNGGSLGSVTTEPFTLTTPPLAAGTYALTAQATASTGLSATSAPVNISVIMPVAISNSLPRVTIGEFAFTHTANPGLRYVVENSITLTNWSPLITNTAVSNSVNVQESFQVGSLRFYRVSLLPNP